MEIFRSKIILFITWILWLYTVTLESDLYTIILLIIASIIAFIFDAVRTKKVQTTIQMVWFPYFVILVWIICIGKLSYLFLL